MRLTSMLALMVMFGTGPVLVHGQDQTANARAKPDNTKVNKRDRQKGEPTADQQKENASDRELTRNIRRSVMQDKSLSTYAHNIKIIAQNGTVTLKGPAHSDKEKRVIEAKASEIAGRDNVKSEISVVAHSEADRLKK